MQRKDTNRSIWVLQKKKQSHENVLEIKYVKQEKAKYWTANDHEVYLKDRQFLFQCRTCGIEAKANKTWICDKLFFESCKDKSDIEIGKHILECSIVCNQNDVKPSSFYHIILISTAQMFTNKFLQAESFRKLWTF